MEMRIGHGFDVHKFETNKILKLCGITVPHSSGLKAHSDGDVAIHALCDAILGALALGDIGTHFPDSNDTYHNFNSQIFLQHVNQMMLDKHYKINNLDLTIVAEIPKLSPFIDKMRENLARILLLKMNQISVKATTTEQLGFIGRKEGIATYAVITLKLL